MRLLHIADWHLGRLTYNHSRKEDHETALQETLDLARDVKPHLICHAGDVFDGPRPAYDVLHRGVTALQELSAIAPVVVLCGNHDSPALFELFNELLGDRGRLRFVSRARAPENGGILEFPGAKDEVVRIAPLPFVHANRMIEHVEDPATWMASYADRVQRIQDLLASGLEESYDPSRHVLLFAAHLHVTGARFSKSERHLHVTDSYATRVERIPQVSYAAYGHIHRPQALPGTVPGRYAGSPIPLDFGEEGEAKEIVVVEAEPGRPAKVEPQPISGGRPLRRIQGTLEEIAKRRAEAASSLCLVTVNTEEPTPNLADVVPALLPGAVLLSVTENCAAHRMTVLTKEDVRHDAAPSFAELFRDYLSEQGTRSSAADRVMSMFEKLIAAVEAEEESTFPEIASLERVAREISAPETEIAREAAS